MSTNVVPFDRGAPPAIFANRTSSLNQAAKQGVQESFAVLGIRGKNWRIKYRGEEELVKGADGSPMQKLPVVIVGVSPYISKQWYESGYTDGSDSAPDCFSVNGVSPDAAAPKKQHATCATCPKNVFGSKITEDGKKAKACQDSRRIAVVPLGDLQNEIYGGPMMLRLPATTLPNLKRYAEMLERKGASLEYVATALRFDYDVAYPKVEFEALGWLTNEQALEVVGPDGNSGLCAHPTLERMLQEPADEVPAAPVVSEPSPLDVGGPPAVLAQRQAAPVQPVQVDAPQEQDAPAPPRRQRAAAFQQPAQVQPQQPAAEPVQAPPTVVTEAPKDMVDMIDSLLNMTV